MRDEIDFAGRGTSVIPECFNRWSVRREQRGHALPPRKYESPIETFGDDKKTHFATVPQDISVFVVPVFCCMSTNSPR